MSMRLVPLSLRRRRLLLAVLAAATASRAGAQAAAPASEAVQFRWAVRSPEVDGLRTMLSGASATLSPGTEPFKPTGPDVEIYADANFAPLVIVAGAVAFAVVLDAVLKFYQGAKRVGAVIDARGPVVEVRELPSLPPGALLVLASGKPPQLLQAAGGTDLAALVKAIAPAGAATAAAPPAKPK